MHHIGISPNPSYRSPLVVKHFAQLGRYPIQWQPDHGKVVPLDGFDERPSDALDAVTTGLIAGTETENHKSERD